jgi:two-component system, NarL family, nitrate/nitrite response regulator NarL
MPSLIADLRALVVASSPLARAGLAAMLENRAGLTVVAQTSLDVDLAETLDIYRPDALVWDVGWEVEGHIARAADVRDSRIPVLALLGDAEGAADAVPALLAAGVRGVLMQDASADRIAAALGALVQGMVVIEAKVADGVLPRALNPAERVSGVPSDLRSLTDSLTSREIEVLNLIAEGLPNKTIASKLGISEHTVKFHVNAILTKFGAQSRTEAVVRATRAGLITL